MADDPLWGDGCKNEVPLVRATIDLRDYFAANAMAAILSSDNATEAIAERSSSAEHARQMVAESAYRHADSMMLERAKGKEQP